MNDLITAATSGLFVEVGKIIEHMKAQQARIADLERQLAEASAAAVEQQKPLGWLRKWAFDGETPRKEKGKWVAKFRLLPITQHQAFNDDVPLYAAPQAADTDKVREAIKAANDLISPWGSFAWSTPESGPYVYALKDAIAELRSTALQAPVREVPEADLWELLPNDAWYLDPPDGGNVSLMEQLRRMSVDAGEWRKLARVGRAPKWISVSDKLPEFRHECTTSGCEVSDSILIYGETEFGTTGCGFGHARDDGTWQCYEAEYDQLTVSKVTHWMLLPAAPVQQEIDHG